LQLTIHILQLTIETIEWSKSQAYTIDVMRKTRGSEMKITIENIPDECEPEIIIRCNEPDESLLQLIYSIKSSNKKLIGVIDLQLHVINPKDVFYFESVDNKVFIYCKDKVFESRLKLYEIEAEYKNGDFFRATKSTILNITKIASISPIFYGKFEASLQNGEKVLISRQYVPVLRKKLGL
jgi:DNA-binding LytR/AlgR family response regulator